MYAKKSVKEICSVLGYTYPKLFTGKVWYVGFFAMDPVTKEPKRKRYSLMHIEKKSERRQHGEDLIFSLVNKLRNGWNPWTNEGDSRTYTLFADCCKKYRDYCERMDRKKTRQSYLSRLNILEEFIETQTYPIQYCYQFDEGFVSDFLDWIYLERESSERTRNNYKGWCSSFAAFMMERDFLSHNPTTKIKDLKEGEKYRWDLNPDQLAKLKNYCMLHNKPFYLACCMMYYTFIRPTELSNLKLKDFSIKEQKVFVSHEYSKNRKDANVGLNANIIKLMIELGTFNNPGDYYLFGEGFVPSATKKGPDQFNKEFAKIRKFLGWGDHYQFYSLKDSGIRDLANSEGVVVARDQARHADITTTNRYIQGRNTSVHEETKNFDGGL